MTIITVFSVSAVSVYAMEDKGERKLNPLSRTPHVLRSPDAKVPTPARLRAPALALALALAEDYMPRETASVIANPALEGNLSGVSRTPLVIRGSSANPYIQPNPQDK